MQGHSPKKLPGLLQIEDMPEDFMASRRPSGKGFTSVRCFEASACSLCPTINSALSPIYLQLHLQAAKLCQHLPGPVMHPWSPRAFVRVPAGSEGRKPAFMRMPRASGTSCNHLLTWHINAQISRMERCELQAVALEAVHSRTKDLPWLTA